MTEVKILRNGTELEQVGPTEEEDFDGETNNFLVSWKGTDNHWTIVNQEKDTKDVTFSKRWLNESGEKEAWAEGRTITVKVTRKAQDAADVEDSYQLIYEIESPGEASLPKEITPAAGSADNAPKLQMISADGYNYLFKLSGLPKTDADGKTYSYFTEEVGVPVDGYLSPSYVAVSNGSEVTLQSDTAAPEGGIIVNAKASIELPSTGGPGTDFYYLLGAILTTFTGTALFIRRKRRRKAWEN